jgi:uncharacterized RDD family membrane protein YckC
MTTAVHVGGERAGFVSRFIALVVDMLIVWLSVNATIWLLRTSAHALGRFAPPVGPAKLVLLSAPVVGALYHIIFWRLRGQTPGKWLLGIRVVALGGGKVGIGRAALRVVGYVISAVPFYLGFFWVLGPRRRGFHDRLARTEVVYVRRPHGERPSPEHDRTSRDRAPLAGSTATA